MANHTILYTTLSLFEVTPMYFTINILIALAALVAIVLNAGIVFIIIVERELGEDCSSIPIKHLAVSDFLCAMMIIYTIIYNLVHYKLFIECLVRFGLLNGISLNSAMITLVLTTERYVKITSPYKYVRFFTPERVSRALLVNWLVCVPVCLLPVFGWNTQMPSNHCSYFGIFTSGYLITYGWLILLSVLIITLMYIHIIAIAISQQRNIFVKNGARMSWKIHRSIWWRPTKTTLIIAGTNICSLAPPAIYVLVAATSLLDWSNGEKGTVLVFACSISYLNTIINPIIYAFRIQRIRKFVRKILRLPATSHFVSDYTVKQEERSSVNHL